MLHLQKAESFNTRCDATYDAMISTYRLIDIPQKSIFMRDQPTRLYGNSEHEKAIDYIRQSLIGYLLKVPTNEQLSVT